MAVTKRIADRQYDIADSQSVTIAEIEPANALGQIYFKQGQVCFGVDAEDGRVDLAFALGKQDFNHARIFDHMVIR